MPSIASRELPHHFGLFGIAEIQAIRRGDRARARAGHVARGFGDGVHRAKARRKKAPAAVAVGRKRERALRFLEAHHGGVARAGADARVRAHHRIVLLGDPVFRRDRGRGKQACENFR